MHKVIELFGTYTGAAKQHWNDIVKKQICPYTNRRCYKVRKSQPEVSIGTCTVLYGTENRPIIICPNRLLENRRVFMDCLHLLHLHQPGNDIHVIPELSVPGGSVDYVIASVRNGRVTDFVGIEFQTLDTTGTVWPERQKFLIDVGVAAGTHDADKGFGMNWKMTAKTILVQIHHKIITFEYLQKHLVLVIQDDFLDYMKREFDFSIVTNPALPGDSLQFHSYSLIENGGLLLQLKDRLSTNSLGVAQCLGLQTEKKVELTMMLEAIEKKISTATLFKI